LSDEIGFGGFAKLYGDRLAESSLLDCNVATRWVFIFMLSKADANGVFRCASLSGLARAASVSRAQASKAVAELGDPDPDSTSPECDGRRILRNSGGWKIVTYQKYREYRSPKQVRDAERQKAWRDMSHNKTPRHAPEVEVRGLTNKRDLDLEGIASINVREKRHRPLPLISWCPIKENFEGEDMEALNDTLRKHYLNEPGRPWMRATWSEMCEWCAENNPQIAAKKDYRKFVLGWFRRAAKDHRGRQRE
jgi:hypothetical protein